jgi:predicted metalloprotease with PDZ domain
LSSAPPPTRYRIAPLDPHAHLFEISCTVERPDPAGQCFRLPVWIPGSYLVREFARNFVSVRAESRGEAVAIAKIAKDAWRAEACSGPLTVVAEVYAFDLSVRMAYLDGARAYFNGPSVFLCPEGRETAPCLVDIAPSPLHARCRVATTLSRVDAPEWGFGTYRAENYDELIDHPVEIADFALITFDVGGVPHDVVISGRHDADLDRLAADLARICKFQVDLFEGRPPFARYLFQIVAVGEGYGGLEHRSSTSLLCSRNDLPRKGMGKVSDDYRKLLGLASHEYFHSWIVKRVKPAAFTPYDLTREAYTTQLWAFEGFTSYYDDLSLVRSGVIDAPSHLELLGRTITSVLRTPGRHRQSVAQSSFDAWIKFYRPDENSPNAVISYYAKGAVVSLALDLTLRASGSSLDELMRLLWRRHGKTGVGVAEDGIARFASELARRDLSEFFARYVDGFEDPPLAELLAGFGVILVLRAAESSRDRGGTAGKPEANAAERPTLGATTSSGSEARLKHVFRDGPAARAGLAAGDVIVAMNELRATGESLDATLERSKPGETVVVHAFRRDELLTFEVTLDPAPLDTAYLKLDTEARGEVLARRQAWLGS